MRRLGKTRKKRSSRPKTLTDYREKEIQHTLDSGVKLKERFIEACKFDEAACMRDLILLGRKYLKSRKRGVLLTD